MKLKTEIELSDLEAYDYDSIASTLESAIHIEIERQIIRELKKDPQVIALVNKLKANAVKKTVTFFRELT